MNDVIRVIKERRTVRSFEKKEVERSKLEAIVDAARYAPSGMNSQCSLFVVVTGEALESLKASVRDFFRGLTITSAMPPFYERCKEWAQDDTWDFCYGAPVCLIVANKKDYRNAMADSAAATMNAMLAAQSLGLSSGWLTLLSGNTEQPEIRSVLTGLGIPENYNVFTSMTIGYSDVLVQASPRTSEVKWVDTRSKR